MRTTGQTLDSNLAAGKFQTNSRLRGIAVMVKTIWRMVRVRWELTRLYDLDDRQLLDIGLRREDVVEANTSAFFSDPSSHLTQAARARARRFYSGDFTG